MGGTKKRGERRLFCSPAAEGKCDLEAATDGRSTGLLSGVSAGACRTGVELSVRRPSARKVKVTGDETRFSLCR